MLRAVLGVIIGYVAMFILVAVSFTIAYMIMGTEGAFREGSFEVTRSWIVLSIIVGIVAALLGGVVCAVIARRGSKAPMVLALLVLILGLLMAIPAMMPAGEEQPATREGDLSNFEAMQQARQPVWIALLNPVIGAAGILLGAALTGRSKLETGAGD
jgi:hypothetical protein